MVCGFVDEFMPVIGAGVGSDFGGAIEQAHAGGGSHQGQGAAQGLRRDRIVVEVKADPEGFIGAHGGGQVAGERMRRKWQQARFLFHENLSDSAGVVTGPGALMSDLVAPVESLTVEIGQSGEGTGGEKVVADILNGALHAAFFIAPGGAAGPSGEMVVGREFEKTGVEMDGLAAAFQDHAAEIVGQNGSGGPTPIGKGMDVAEEKILQGLVEEELQPQSAAVGEGEDEAGQTTAGATDGHFSEVGPVGLRLLAGER